MPTQATREQTSATPKKASGGILLQNAARWATCPMAKPKNKRQQHEHTKASSRARVEHAFQMIKCTFGYRKTRFKGLAKSTSRVRPCSRPEGLHLS
jgi:hypothetical protein